MKSIYILIILLFLSINSYSQEGQNSCDTFYNIDVILLLPVDVIHFYREPSIDSLEDYLFFQYTSGVSLQEIQNYRIFFLYLGKAPNFFRIGAEKYFYSNFSCITQEDSDITHNCISKLQKIKENEVSLPKSRFWRKISDNRSHFKYYYDENNKLTGKASIKNKHTDKYFRYYLYKATLTYYETGFRQQWEQPVANYKPSKYHSYEAVIHHNPYVAQIKRISSLTPISRKEADEMYKKKVKGK